MRGTQSFVGVMAEVFKRPWLTGLEVLWRWLFWAVVLGKQVPTVYADIMQAVNAFQAGGFAAFGAVLVSLGQQLRAFVGAHVAWLVLALVFWIGGNTAGRRLLLRRVDLSLSASPATLVMLTALRWLAWALFLGAWCGGLIGSLSHFVFTPQAAGVEAEWIPFCGVAIAGTLLFYVLWLGLSWVFSLASLFAGHFGTGALASLRAAWSSGPLQGRVAEINLVVGIVKIALLVLAMVFSACPLPFETVETQGFLVTWTAVVLLLYFVASDYFHVVRLVAFLRMTEVFGVLPAAAAARDGEAAS